VLPLPLRPLAIFLLIATQGQEWKDEAGGSPKERKKRKEQEVKRLWDREVTLTLPCKTDPKKWTPRDFRHLRLFQPSFSLTFS